MLVGKLNPLEPIYNQLVFEYADRTTREVDKLMYGLASTSQASAATGRPAKKKTAKKPK